MMRGARPPGIHVLIASLLVVAGCAPKPKPTGVMVPLPGGAVGAPVGTTGGSKPAGPSRDQSQPTKPVTDNGPQSPAVPGSAGNGSAPIPVLPPLTTGPLIPTGGASVVNGGSSGGGGRNRPEPTGLRGLVSGPAPILANNGGAIISNNGSRIISNNGSAIISNNGSAIISNNGSALLSDGGASYRLLAESVEQKALTNAFIYLTNRDEKYHLDSEGRILATTVDGEGRFDFASDIPAGKDVIVNAIANGNLRLVGFGVPTAEDSLSVNVNVATTAATEYLRGDAYRADKALTAYDQTQFKQAVTLTEQAVSSGALETVRTVTDQAGEAVTVGVFDLRADRTGDLRNQYVIGFSAADVGNTVLEAISDAWTALLGERPTAITSLAGNGSQPKVNGSNFLEYGFASEDHRGAGPFTPLAQVPLGNNYGIATATRGDIFISAYTPSGNTGHIRWIRPDGKVTSIWLPTYALGSPLGLVVEKQPTDDINAPGTLLVADAGTNSVMRIHLVDEVNAGAHLVAHPTQPKQIERLRMEVVVGEGYPYYAGDDPDYGYLETEHPHVVSQVEADAYAYTDGASPQTSNWRATDEGARTYQGTTDPVPNASRYGHVDQPTDVEVDELGNIYIADKANQRIRFIPSVAGAAAAPNAFQYAVPILDADQQITALSGTRPTMVAGAIYTIAGNPAWEPSPVLTPSGSSHWFGDYGGDGGAAQLAKLDSPYALAFNRTDRCLYVADIDNNRIRKISRDTGVITTFAGAPVGIQRSNGQGDSDFAPGYVDGPAASAQFGFPRGLAFDAQNRLYIADSANGLIRMVADGVVSTVAGRFHPDSGVPTDNADDGDARHFVDLYETEKLDVDPQGNVVFNDYRHGRLRKLWRQWD